MSDEVKSAFDVASFAVVGATLVDWLPAIAALLSIAWSFIRLYETKTVQGWIKGR